MPWLADTNILLRLMHRADPDHRLVRTALQLLSGRGDRIFYAPHNNWSQAASRVREK